LGLGAGAIGEARISESEAEALLLEAVDLGITLFDTARSYGLSEERLGRVLGARGRLRGQVVLSTKGGYGIDGVLDWTGAAVARGIDEALVRLRTDRIDVFHLHSCPLDTLRSGEVLEEALRARERGKVRVVSYSGENEALAWAVAGAQVGSVQCSVNVFDQRALDGAVRDASARGVGVVAKRALGNAPWRFATMPQGHYAQEYWRRMMAMKLDPSPLAWNELALRFAAFAPGVSSALVGTASLDHLRECARIIERGALERDLIARIRAAFAAGDSGWDGQI
jgi:aryl-alcohol dehydrogenase-like predicted oxidoreductase